MKLAIRPADFCSDYPALARLLTAENPEWPTTPEELAREDAARDANYHRAVFVAEDIAQVPPQMIGMASVGHDAWAHREGKFKMDIRVHPDLQGRGVGACLYQTLFASLEPYRVDELYTQVWEVHPRATRFVTDRGFVEAWRRIDSSLDVSNFDAAPYAGQDEKLRALSIEIVTYADLAHDPGRLVKLYELDKALWQDVPFGETVTTRSLRQFEQEEVQATKFLPEACFIAVHEGTFIGYANLTRTGVYYDAEMTGVLPAFRGKGVATVLKLHTIHYAQSHGNHAIWTVNDSVNTTMITLNTNLGFQRQGAIIRFVKHMEP